VHLNPEMNILSICSLVQSQSIYNENDLMQQQIKEQGAISARLKK
jgi:hypothetical protein